MNDKVKKSEGEELAASLAEACHAHDRVEAIDRHIAYLFKGGDIPAEITDGVIRTTGLSLLAASIVEERELNENPEAWRDLLLFRLIWLRVGQEQAHAALADFKRRAIAEGRMIQHEDGVELVGPSWDKKENE